MKIRLLGLGGALLLALAWPVAYVVHARGWEAAGPRGLSLRLLEGAAPCGSPINLLRTRPDDRPFRLGIDPGQSPFAGQRTP